MSTYADASLIYYPSGYKAGTAYSLKPTDGSGDLTFTRASSATRVNAEGLIEKDLTIDILIYGFQLEVGDVMTDYIPTTTAAVSVGMLADVPRIDYTGGGCAKLLLEPQRTNLVTYSSEFDNAAWTKGSGVSVTANTTIAPTGTLTADTLIGASGIDWTLSVLKRQLPPVLSSTTYTLSIYVKSLGSTTFQTSIRNNNTGSQVTVSHSINSDTWTRVEQTYTTTPTQTLVGVIFGGTDGDVAIWGAQFEAGSYPTSYIPTTTTAVTRTQDTASKTGISSLINSTEGVLYAEISALADDLTYRILSISDGTTAERIYIQYTNVTNTVAVVIKNGSTTQANMGYALSDETELAKVAIKYKANDFALWVNGFEVGTDASGTTPTGLSELAFDDGGGANHFYGNVQSLMIFPSALSDTELATLTTL
jgi:hypothetical protein